MGSFQQAGFPHIKTFEGYVYDHISFPNGSSPELLRKLDWLEHKKNLLLSAVAQEKSIRQRHWARRLAAGARLYSSTGLPKRFSYFEKCET